MKSGGRPVKVTLKNYRDGRVTTDTEQGVFHCWGYRKSKNPEDKPKITAIETVGVIELSSGQIRIVKPEGILFTDRGAQ